MDWDFLLVGLGERGPWLDELLGKRKGSKERGGLHGIYGKEERENIHCPWH